MGFRLALALLIAALWCAPATAQTPRPLLDEIFQDHAVLQRDEPARVWGEAPARASVALRLDRTTIRVRADASGHWRASLPRRAAGGPHTLSVSAAGASQSISDVMFGDVFLCSGQSNMAFAVSDIGVDAAALIRNTNEPSIRLLKIPSGSSASPHTDFVTTPVWRLANAESVADFSAACFFMGRGLQRATQAPIGLIEAAVSGSIIEAWVGAEAIARLGGYDEPLAEFALFTSDRPAAQARFEQRASAWWSEHEPGMRQRWQSDSFDDSSWPPMPEGAWENSGDPALSNFDGSVWLRTSITLSAAQAAQTASLSLGLVDDYDNTFLNGVRLGGYRDKGHSRHYDIPAGLLHAGRNVIAVGVIDTGTSGGLIAGGDARAINFADGSSVPIPGPWRYHISAPLDVLGRGPLAPWAGGLVAHYNGTIAPIGPYNLRGIAWYQGESNVDDADQYARLLTALMADWRGQFENAALPYLIVQLPNFGAATPEAQFSAWANLREAQRRVANADAHAALVATIDIGDRYNIHPTQKLEVGRRLAFAARALIYGENIVSTGPTPAVAQRAGEALEISFDHAEGGLLMLSAGDPVGFQLCDAERHCRFAAASSAAGSSMVRLMLRTKDRFVRYCWADSPLCNVSNTANLPAVPFELALP